MYKKRVPLLILAILMVLTLFAGCSGEGNKDTTASAKNTTAEATTAAPVDYEGYKFTITNSEYFPKYDANGLPQSALDEEWQQLYDELETRLNIEIELVTLDNNDDTLGAVAASTMSGNKIADLIWCRQDCYWPGAKNGYFLPVDGDKLINQGLDCTDAERWFQPAINETEAFGNKWGLSVASKFIPVKTGYFIAFNKNIVSTCTGNNDLYQLVRDKKWTWDVYLDYAMKCTKDTTGDGVPDQWGTGVTAWGNEVTTNNVDFVGQDSTGKWVVMIDQPAGIDALQFLVDLNNYQSGARCPKESNNECRQAFVDGQVAFNWTNMGYLNPGSAIPNVAFDYGLIPMPLGPNATEYVSSHDDNDVFAIQSSNKDLDKAVNIMNEWALIVNDTENYLDILDDGRCPTEDDKEMMEKYIIPNFNLTHFEIDEELTNAIDEGIISGVSYYGMTPQQAIESYKAVIQARLDVLFNS